VKRFIAIVALVAAPVVGLVSSVASPAPASAAAACFLPRHWHWVATGYNRQTGTSFGRLVCS